MQTNLKPTHLLKSAVSTLKIPFQIPRQTALGRAGGPGHPVHQGERLGQEPVIIRHLMEVEQPAWAPPLRLIAVRHVQIICCVFAVNKYHPFTILNV